jgi:UDP-2,3-diacylglucosamine hydrolase
MTEPRPTLFLSDLHLPPEASPLRERFLRFIEHDAPQAGAVYILGDLFEYWIGDDAGLSIYAPEVAALAALVAGGVPVYFQHGNRDFLVGAAFFELTGIQCLKDPEVVTLDGRRTLISHGDVFCTDDVGYQRWRRFSRNRAAQWLFLRLPLSLRTKIAGGVRSGSDSAKRNKPDNIMDVNPDSVRSWMESTGVTRLVHGHTHRPQTHHFTLRGSEAERIVLPDWRPQRCEVLAMSAMSIETRPIA